MLLFITARDRDRLCYWVSIHLMLLFIELLSARIWIAFVFQYISCYSLSELAKGYEAAYILFQYISCYSLSMISSVHLKITKCFNTSHVTLYRQSISLLHLYLKFQYISCYSLSSESNRSIVFPCVSIHLMLLFIGISCYSYNRIKIVSIHLMLLFISKSSLMVLSLFSFNTSHVTLYLRDHQNVPSCC